MYAKGRGVAVMHDGSPLGASLAQAAALGASAAGSSPLLLGEGFLSLCSFGCRLFSPALAVYAAADGLSLLNRRGLPLCRAAERRLESLFFARETPAESVKARPRPERRAEKRVFPPFARPRHPPLAGRDS